MTIRMFPGAGVSSSITINGRVYSVAGAAVPAAKTITAAAIGNPTIFTSAAHTLTVGTLGIIAAVTGTISTINNATVPYSILAVTTNTFAVNFDSTGLAYTSGGTFTPQNNLFVDMPDGDAFAAGASGWVPVDKGIGTTAQRPLNPNRGFEYTDTTLGQSLFFDGTSWRNPATGAVA